MKVYPDYYLNFKCIAGECKHNCCIGWEIDIDPDTLAFYDTVPGPLGERLQKAIDRAENPHFKLAEGERCPFLNGQNLCDLILGLGEEHLCGICAAHPRFCNELPGREEWGLGLCCEAAGRLILGQKEPIRLVYEGEPETEDAILDLRDAVLVLLQDRGWSIEARIGAMLAHCGAKQPEGVPVGKFLQLERLEEAWTERLTRLAGSKPEPAGFAAHMADRQTEYEQFLVYLIYRHFANAPDLESAAARASFAALGYQLLFQLGAEQWQRTGAFTFEDQVELARQFSAEIEYSDENLYILLEEMKNPML